MITVHLHGPFRTFHDGPIKVIASTVAEAIEIVTNQLKGFRPGPDGMKRLRVAGHDTLESLYAPLEGDEEIHLMPLLWLNEKDNRIVQIVVGVTLIAIGLAMGGTFWPALLINIGASMVIGGVMALFVPVPRPTKEDEERSRYLGAPPNTVGTNVRIAIGYGEDLFQGHFVSSDTDAAELV